jgi:signal transduction histidine kinase
MLFATAPGLILVVDDNDSVRYGKVRILRQAGFEVIEAATGMDTLRLVAECMPRLVLLDVQLPDINGWEICRRIKGNPETASVLVLQVSATYVHGEDTVRALEGGADASLTEPIEPTVLVATVNAMLRARHAEDALREALAREQTARQAAEDANRTKDEFLATLSHELRTPLGAILTWVTLLRFGRLDEAKSERGLEAIERNARLQTRMIEDLLDVSRIISGKLRIEVGPVDLAAVVDAALDAVRPAAEKKGVRLKTSIARDLGIIAGDGARLQQIASNLVANAIKFTPKDGLVTVGLEASNGSARIRVTDDGRGIEPAFLPHIFERFRQADSSSTRAEGGLGLGLAIVRHLVELHGGTVEATSAGIGRGATFTVTLPRTAMPSIAGAPRLPPMRVRGRMQPLPRLDAVRVLVVDDEIDARDAIAAVLQRCGAGVTVVGSVRDALDRLSEDGVDVVVSDIAMPVEDGYRLIEAMRGSQRDGTRVPALALTAYASADEQRRILGAGFDACLAKPVEAITLAAEVARLAKVDDTP